MTLSRILAALPAEVARRYGHAEQPVSIKEQLRRAVEAEDWEAVDRLRAELAGRQEPDGRWRSEDGEAFDAATTLAALRVLRSG